MTASSSSRVVKVGLVQMRHAAQAQANLAMAAKAIEQAAAKGAQIVSLSELFTGLYPCQQEDHAKFAEAEPIPGPSTQALAELARKHKLVIVGSLFERRAPGLFHNTAVVLDNDGSLVGLYRKMHIPDDPLYYEKFYFTPGDLGFRAFNTAVGKIGVCVCWDQWYPEAARLTALHGAEIIFYPTAIGWHPSEKAEYGESQHRAWETMMRSHAIANGLFVAGINRIGTEENLEFWGGTFMCDPYGNLMAKASFDQPEVVVVECRMADVETARTHWPFLRDRRIDAYGDLCRRYVDDT